MIYFQKLLALVLIMFTLNNNAAGESPRDGVFFDNFPAMKFTSWAFDLDRSVSMDAVSSPNLGGITFTTQSSSISVMFFEHAITRGQSFTQVILRQDAFTLEMQNVVVSSYSSTSGATDTVAKGGDASLSLNFSKMIVSIGSEFDFDIKTNKECITKIIDSFTAEKKEDLDSFLVKNKADKDPSVKANMLKMMNGPNGKSIKLLISMGMQCN